MALLLTNHLLACGITVPSIYAKIDYVSGNKIGCALKLKCFVNKEAADEDRVPITQYEHSFDPSVADDAPNFIKQGYEFLKTLPEYADALDA